MKIIRGTGLFVIVIAAALLFASSCQQQQQLAYPPGGHPMGPDCDNTVADPNVCSVAVKWFYNHSSSDHEIHLHPSRGDELKITHSKPFKFWFVLKSAEPGVDCKDVQSLPPFLAVTFPYQTSGNVFRTGPANSNAAGCHYKTIVDDGQGPSDPHIFIDPTP